MLRPVCVEGKAVRPTRFYSNKQEKQVAKAIGGRKTANSGAPKFVAGDVTTNQFLIECKTHTELRNSFNIKREWIEKNEEEAFQMGKRYSALVIDFGDGENHYLINEKLFSQLVNYLEEENK